MGRLRTMKPEEETVCRDNGIDTTGKDVIICTDTYIMLRCHKTGDDITICFGEARKRKATTK